MKELKKKTDPAIITPEKLVEYVASQGNGPKPALPDALVMCYQTKIFDYVMKNHKTTQIRGHFPHLYLLDETDGKVAIMGRFGIGSVAASSVLEMLIGWGVKKVVSMGTAGTLQSDVKIGDIILCDRAISEEGVSDHYFDDASQFEPSHQLTEKLADSLKEQGIAYKKGATWTTDAPYRETIEKVKRYQKEGVVTVEMEASALFAIAAYRDIEIASAFSVSDSLADLQWHPGFHKPENQVGLEQIFQAALHSLQS